MRTEYTWDMKRVNSFHNLESGRFNFKRNKRFDSLSWSLFLMDLYTRRGFIIVELNGEQDKAIKAQKKEVDDIFPFGLFQFYLLIKGFLACLNEQVKYSLSDHLNLNEFTTLSIQDEIVISTLFHSFPLFSLQVMDKSNLAF